MLRKVFIGLIISVILFEARTQAKSLTKRAADSVSFEISLSPVSPDQIVKAEVEASSSSNQNVNVILTISGGNFEFLEVVKDKCEEIKEKSRSKSVAVKANGKNSTSFYFMPLDDGAYELNIIGKVGSEILGEKSMIIKTYKETEPKEKVFDLRKQKYDSYYIGETEERTFQNNIKVFGQLQPKLQFVDKVFDNRIDLLPAAYPYAQSFASHTESLKPGQKQEINEKIKNFYTESVPKIQRDNSINLLDGPVYSSAYFVKFLKKTEEYNEIDTSLINPMCEYLVNSQNMNGSFTEKSRRSTKLEEQVTLTAFVSIALYSNSGCGKEATTKAFDFIDTNLDGIDDIYTLAIGSFALAFERADSAEGKFKKIMQKSIEKDGKFTFDYPEESKKIETIAYAILVASRLGKNVNALGLMKELGDHQDRDGTFGSPTSTVIAYQASEEIAKHFYSSNNDITLHFTDDNDKKTSLKVSKPLEEIEIAGTSVSFNAEGLDSIALVQIVRRYRDSRTVDKSDRVYEVCGSKAVVTEPPTSGKNKNDNNKPDKTWLWIVIGIIVAALHSR